MCIYGLSPKLQAEPPYIFLKVKETWPQVMAFLNSKQF